MNGHNEEPEDDDKAMMKPSSRTAVQGRNKEKSYHPSHHNALHYMGKAASEFVSDSSSSSVTSTDIEIAGNGFTPEHIDSLLHLGTYAMGALANTHGLAPAEPVEQ